MQLLRDAVLQVFAKSARRVSQEIRNELQFVRFEEFVDADQRRLSSQRSNNIARILIFPHMFRDRHHSTIQRHMHDPYVVVDPAPDTLKCGRIDLANPLKVSFCIPTLNSEKTIGQCLKSITSQDYPNIEIVIVDGGSSDGTVEVAREYTDNVFFDKGTLGSARQTSMARAAGKVLAIFDDDIVIPRRSWLKNVITYFNFSERVSTVWPMVTAPPDAGWTTRLYNNIHKNKVQDHVSKQRGNWGGGNALFWRQYMEDIGGIDSSLRWGEDYDWAKRLKDEGYQVILTYDALHHNTMTSLREFAKKQYIGAGTLSKDNFATTGLSRNEVLYEQFVAGFRGMGRGLFKERDYSWVLYPLFVLIRVIAYGSAYLERVLR